jgi:hypothetical protein
MKNTRLLINNFTGTGYREADLTDNIKVVLVKYVEEARDPFKATGAFSLDVTLPFTNNNKQIFKFQDDKQLVGKFKEKYKAVLMQDNQVLITGYVLMLSNIRSASTQGFKIAVGAERDASALKIGDLISDKKLSEIKSFAPINFQGNSSVVDSWSNTSFYPTSETAFAHVVRSFAELKYQPANVPGTQQIIGAYHSGYEDLGISHFTAAIVKNIFSDAGYTIQGDILGNEAFQKLLLLYSNTDVQRWNYGTLAPMRAEVSPDPYGFGLVFEGGVAKTYNRQNDSVEVLTLPWHSYQGDLCESLGLDGVYTCKFSGIYEIRVSQKHAYQGYGTNGQSANGQGGFTIFRCISDQQFLDDSMLPPQGQWGTLPALPTLGIDTIAVGGDSPFTFTTSLVAGKQYQIQRYAQVSNRAQYGDSTLNPNEGNFFINSCNGPLTVNPAAFLPDMKQSEFLQAIFKIFNLYYELNSDTKTITLFGRDDFYQESIADIVDLNPYISLDNMDDIPFSDEETASVYLNWETDENDYILDKTDYMEKVNGITPDGATVLPFAPVGFMKVNLTTTLGAGADIVPAIIPTTDDEGQAVLDDEAATTAPGSWVPRLALYQDAAWIRTDLNVGYAGGTGNFYVSLGRNYPGTPGIAGNIGTGGGYQFVALPPKLTFFNISNQPTYEVVVNPQLRNYNVSLASGATIYNTADPNYLIDPTRVSEIDSISLATNVDAVVNPKGFFYELYSNDLLNANLSYYVQGQGRMNPVLFNKLTGRQAIALDDDLYFLTSLTNYQIGSDFATYKLSKMLSNTALVVSGGTGTGNILYTSTQTVTASCPTNTTGTDVTATATRTSYVSQAKADQLAHDAAMQVANSQLVCTVTQWVGTGSVQVFCPNGSYGHSNTVTATATSTISQNDAIAQAFILAEQQALAGLVCYTSPITGGNMINNLVTQIQGNLTPQANYQAALALVDADMADYLYAPTARIRVGSAVYIQTQGNYYALVDGYYGFVYRVGNNNSTQGFQIVNGVVNNYIDNVRAGGTA